MYNMAYRHFDRTGTPQRVFPTDSNSQNVPSMRERVGLIVAAEPVIIACPAVSRCVRCESILTRRSGVVNLADEGLEFRRDSCHTKAI